MEAKWRQAQLPSARPEAIPTPAQEREEQGQPCSSEGLNGLLGFSNRWFIFPQSAGEPCSNKRLEDLSIPHLLSRCQDPSLRSFQQRIILPWAPGAIRLTASPPRLEAFQRRARPPRSPPDTTVVSTEPPSLTGACRDSCPGHLCWPAVGSPLGSESPCPLSLRHSDKGRRNTASN